MADFPISNNNAVINELSQTCHHFIFVSGKNLKINVNNNGRVLMDTIKFKTSNTTRSYSEK